MSYKKILVPVDFSEFSDKAAEYAMNIARKYNASVTLLHVIILFQEDYDEEEQLKLHEKILKKKESERKKKLEKHSKKAEDKGIQVNSVLLRGFSIANSIMEYISENDIDLVVLGTHGHTGFKKWLLGSVTEEVVRESPIPVLTVHKDFSKTEIEKILIPIDFSDYSKITVDHGKKLAREFKATLEFLHVVEMESHPEFYSISFEPIIKANPGLIDHVVDNMVKLTGIDKNQAVYKVTEGKVYKEIRKYAENNQIDMIIMGTRGISDLEDFLVGSNSERVLRIAACPVLTVRENS